MTACNAHPPGSPACHRIGRLGRRLPDRRLRALVQRHPPRAPRFQGRNPGGATNGFGDGDFTQADFNELAAAGANYVQISHAGLFAETPPYAPNQAAQDNLDQVISMAPAPPPLRGDRFLLRAGPLRERHQQPRRHPARDHLHGTRPRTTPGWRCFGTPRSATALNPTVVGYSIMVEPNAYARHGYIDPPDFYATYIGTLEDVNGLYADAVAAIRQVDTETPILLEPEGYGNVNWLANIVAINDPHMVYTAHDYTPFDYTHEQIAQPDYPGDLRRRRHPAPRQQGVPDELPAAAAELRRHARRTGGADGVRGASHRVERRDLPRRSDRDPGPARQLGGVGVAAGGLHRPLQRARTRRRCTTR